MEKRLKKIIAYLARKYYKTYLTKDEARKELLYEIDKKRISIDDVARLICDEYRLGVIV